MLLIGSRGQQRRQAADEVAHRLGIQLAMHQIGANGLVDTTGTWTTRYGVTDSGAVPVRPDRFIAWRSTEHTEHLKALDAAPRHVLDR